MALLFILGLKGPQLIFIALILLLVFGAGRIPNLMRSLGKGIHSFKQGIEDAKEEINRDVVKRDAPKDANAQAAAQETAQEK